LLFFTTSIEEESTKRLQHNISILCDNNDVINLYKNLIIYSKMKHIKIKHNFIRDNVQKKIVDLLYVSTKNHLVEFL